MFIIAHLSILIMAALKSLADNSNIFAICVSIYRLSFFHLVWRLPGS